MMLYRLATIFACSLICGVLIAAPETRPVSAQESESVEEQLTARHAPILFVSVLTSCFRDGGYDPAPVSLVLDQPANTLVSDEGRVVTAAPGAPDVYEQPRRYYINWPGNPKNPGCGYERRYRELRAELPVVMYAHVATEEGRTGVAVQYWFFYYYNDFLNLHEGDWEMIQVIYDEAETPEQALGQEPTRIAYSGHAGGEQGDWTDDKVRKDGDRPVVFVARGSHAAYFEPGTYLGVAKAGTVFGCDPVESPFRRLAPEVIVLPEAATGPQDPFAWIEFDGMWGEEKGALFSGPTGPKERGRWDEPISWTDGLRHFSEKISAEPVAGLDPVSPVCTMIGWGSQALIWYRENPAILGLGALGVVVVSVGALVTGVPDYLTRTSRRRLAEESHLKPPSIRRPGFLYRPRTAGRLALSALRLYATRPFLFIGIGAVFIPLAAAFTVVQGLSGTTWLEDQVNTTFMEPVFMAAASSLGSLIATITAGAAMSAAIGRLDSGQPVNVLTAYRQVYDRLASLAGANARATAITLLFTISVIGLPFAINRLVNWAFVTQEVMLRGSSAREALRDSSAHVGGNWWRCMTILIWLGLLVTIPGPLIAFSFLVFTEPPVTGSVYIVNMVLYAGLLLPLAAITITLLFGDLVWRRRAEEAVTDNE